ncbi:hypothetical protein BST81_10755 [Leptolyngbya sp. 'hensonii']|uniref:lipase family protein n=1 Tax=Leptolyngbya sp. 'hensonii' TaxID=1922337 RepID=UPI00095005FE|nr:lipase family protein [Leptolyngbya sp. 'hensonii']OLP18432.1 hypothetical protein BST81_10755 [Leptolyngbya sp. 'hensonii']
MENLNFKPKAFGYHPYNAYFLALVSQLAYEKDGKAVQAKAQSWGIAAEDIQPFDCGGTQAILLADSEKIIVAFRGTEPILADWITDLKIRKTAGPGGNVHRGFYAALACIWADVENAIEQAIDKASQQQRQNPAYTRPTLWFTGHSLGGALATMATAFCKFNEQPIVVNGLYTFGQPRVGSEKFAANFNNLFKAQTFRFVNNNDVVARLPPSLMDYSHVGQLKYFDHEGNFKSDGDLNWWNTFWDRAAGLLEESLNAGPDQINDHSLDEQYIPHLLKHVQQWEVEQKPPSP